MFLDKKGIPIYIGKTDDLNARFQSHKENKVEMWREHYKIRINKFNCDEEPEQSAYEKLMIMKYSPKYNVTDNYKSTLDIIDTRSDKWENFDILTLKTDNILTNKSTIKIVQQRQHVKDRKSYDSLYIRKEDGFIKISGNGTVKLDESCFLKLIELMSVLLKEGFYIHSEDKVTVHI